MSVVSGQTEMTLEEKLVLIEKEVESAIATEDIPAVSLALVVNNTEVHYLNYGNFDRSLDRPVNEESLYQIASLGKTFIGLVANNLILEGKISPDQAITDFLKDKISEKTYSKLSQISILQLLHHRSGLPADAKVGFKRKDGTSYLYDYTEQDLLNS